MIKITLIIILLYSFSCQRTNRDVASDISSSHVYKEQPLIRCEENSSATYELCQSVLSNEKRKVGIMSISYFLLKKEGNDTILRGSIDSGYIKWINEDVIEIFQFPGNISTEFSKNDLIEVYLIAQNKKISKTEYLKSN